MKNIVVLTGAGISAESGLGTFRDSNGLWDSQKMEDVATVEGWQRNRPLVLDFYNKHRKTVIEALPNDAHLALVRLEEKYNVNIITQNVDDLHERAGSKNITHLHGLITKAQSEVDPSLVYQIEGWEMFETDNCIHGKVLRPHVVWFGEPVLNFNYAASVCKQADIFIVIGTSLKVVPAADLVTQIPNQAIKFLIDPDIKAGFDLATKINMNASEGVKKIVYELLK